MLAIVKCLLQMHVLQCCNACACVHCLMGGHPPCPHWMQEDGAAMGRRLAAAEAAASTANDALSGLRRLATRLADSDARTASSAARLASVAATLPVLTGQVAATEQRVGGKLSSAFKVLDNLADQLAALGNMPRPAQKPQALAGEAGSSGAPPCAHQRPYSAGGSTAARGVSLWLGPEGVPGAHMSSLLAHTPLKGCLYIHPFKGVGSLL